MIAIALSGLAVGLILALTGAGGGVLAVPLLVYGAGMSMVQAGPVALVAVGLGAAASAVLGLRDCTVRYRAALLIAGCGILLAPLGLWSAKQVGSRWLSALFALILLHVARNSWRRGAGWQPAAGRQPACRRDPATGRLRWTSRCARELSVSGGLAGLLSGLLGVGGGFVVVPALLRATDLPVASIVATSLSVVALVSLSGVAAGVASGAVAWQLVLPFCAGTLAGMFAGRTLAGRLPESTIHKAFAALAALTAAAMLAGALLYT